MHIISKSGESVYVKRYSIAKYIADIAIPAEPQFPKKWVR